LESKTEARNFVLGLYKNGTADLTLDALEHLIDIQHRTSFLQTPKAELHPWRQVPEEL